MDKVLENLFPVFLRFFNMAASSKFFKKYSIAVILFSF